MVNNTVWALTPQLQAKQNRESGRKERDFIGFKINEIIIVF